MQTLLVKAKSRWPAQKAVVYRFLLSVKYLILFLLNRLTGPNQSINCDVRDMCVCPLCVSIFSKRLITAIYKGPKTKKNQLQKYSLHKSDERTLVLEFVILAQEWSKTAQRKKSRFLSLCKQSCSTQCGSQQGEGVVAVAVGVSDM